MNHFGNNNNNTNALQSNKLPPISAIDDYLSNRRQVPPTTPIVIDTQNSTPSSLSTPPQPDHWESPPYHTKNELSRDSLFDHDNHTKSQQLLFSPPNNTSRHHNRHRSASSSSDSSTVENNIQEIVYQCNTLCSNMLENKNNFINSQSTTSSHQDFTSARPWLDDMIGRANKVLNSLLRLRKHQIATENARQIQRQQQQSSTNVTNSIYNTSTSNASSFITNNNNNTWQSTDQNNSIHDNTTTPMMTHLNIMSINNSDKQKKKGKKPVFQGRCHSCNISDTPEWRRGPDGARTLCNACGLHYAKLTRKQQENRGMSSKNSHILATSPSRRVRYGSSTSPLPERMTPPPPGDALLLDKLPTG